MIAKTITNQVSVVESGVLPDGVKYLTLDLYNDYLKMPVSVEFNGVQYGRTGWNSDSRIVYYRTDKKTATILK
jgi:hypothetical protein